jgi:mRNA-capping enzyme
MIVAMDLNASPVPEEDEDVFDERVHVQEYIAPEERVESGAEIARREREERKKRLKRERPDDRHVHPSQSPRYDQQFHTKKP